MKHPVGRPSEYDPSNCDKVDEYLENASRENMHLPKVESFAIYLGVTKKTLYNWSKEHEEFLHALDKIMTIQAERLIDDGIYGGKEVNATIVKLLLMNNHDMREKNDTDMTSGGEKITEIRIIEDAKQTEE